MTDPSMPEPLARRARDQRRGVPIPVMNMPPGSTDPAEADFTGIHAQSVYDCGTERRCGICGDPLGYWIAFLGGPVAAQSRAYVDPPFHPECAETALRLCPHIAVPHHKRAPEHRLAETSHTPTGFVEEKAAEWVMGITRDYRIEPYGRGHVFRPAPFRTIRRFAYVDGTLTEHGG